MPTLPTSAFGLRVHSGWAALVALSGPAAAPAVVDRRRLVLCDDSFPRQPYHAAEHLPPAEAAALVGRSLETARRLGEEEIGAAVRDRRRAGQSPARAGLLLGSARPLPPELTAILGSHPLIHTAEGEMYRGVLRRACERSGLAVVDLREREVEATAAQRLRLSADDLRRRVADMGRLLGPPWTQDQKLAALAAWLALASRGPRGR
jgi:hypothetical protein